ncbi:hypothetical protein [uncultured Maricaulis sp.]|uniref:hypothetical protein n=1 Tax=uncultured Maricaulis sp. TaxID=174710 RepID=UPI002634CF4E|nr:hypothetical protein [uncultured Maricaulis sp.]
MTPTTRTLLASLAALSALAAPALAQKGAAPAATADCGLSATADWGGDPASGLTARAVTACDANGRIHATLSLVDATGTTQFEARYPTDEVMLLAWAEPGQLAPALADWLTAFTDLDNTTHIPGPDAEFPFYAAEDLTETDINTLRTEARDMACYVQGMESANCLVREGDGVREIGLMLFPG